MTIRTIDIPQLLSPIYVKYKLNCCVKHTSRPSVAFSKERYIEGYGMVGHGMCTECLHVALSAATKLGSGYCSLCDTFFKGNHRVRVRLCLNSRIAAIYSCCPSCVTKYIASTKEGIGFKVKNSVFSGALNGVVTY